MSKFTLPSLSGLGNIVLLLVINLVLTLAFLDQFINHDLPCPLCILQRMAFTYGFAILFAILGLSVSLRQVLLHVAPGDLGYGDTFFHLHFYTWAFVGFVSLMISIAVLLIIPDHGTRGRHWFAQFVCLWFILLLVGNLISTLSICGLGACADNPLHYDGIEQLRQWLAK